MSEGLREWFYRHLDAGHHERDTPVDVLCEVPEAHAAAFTALLCIRRILGGPARYLGRLICEPVVLEAQAWRDRVIREVRTWIALQNMSLYALLACGALRDGALLPVHLQHVMLELEWRMVLRAVRPANPARLRGAIEDMAARWVEGVDVQPPSDPQLRREVMASELMNTGRVTHRWHFAAGHYLRCGLDGVARAPGPWWLVPHVLLQGGEKAVCDLSWLPPVRMLDGVAKALQADTTGGVLAYLQEHREELTGWARRWLDKVVVRMDDEWRRQQRRGAALAAELMKPAYHLCPWRGSILASRTMTCSLSQLRSPKKRRNPSPSPSRARSKRSIWPRRRS